MHGCSDGRWLARVSECYGEGSCKFELWSFFNLWIMWLMTLPGLTITSMTSTTTTTISVSRTGSVISVRRRLGLETLGHTSYWLISPTTTTSSTTPKVKQHQDEWGPRHVSGLCFFFLFFYCTNNYWLYIDMCTSITPTVEPKMTNGLRDVQHDRLIICISCVFFFLFIMYWQLFTLYRLRVHPSPPLWDPTTTRHITGPSYVFSFVFFYFLSTFFWYTNICLH